MFKFFLLLAAQQISPNGTFLTELNWNFYAWSCIATIALRLYRVRSVRTWPWPFFANLLYRASLQGRCQVWWILFLLFMVPPNTSFLVFGRSQIFGTWETEYSAKSEYSSEYLLISQIASIQLNTWYSAEYFQSNGMFNIIDNWLNVQYLPLHLTFGCADWMFDMNGTRTRSNPQKVRNILANFLNILAIAEY